MFKYKIPFLNNDFLILESENPVTKSKIYKLVDLSLGEKAFEYYDTELYLPLSAEEKAQYGLNE